MSYSKLLLKKLTSLFTVDELTKMVADRQTQTYVKNPLSNRQVKINGPTYKRLIREGYELNGGALVKSFKQLHKDLDKSFKRLMAEHKVIESKTKQESDLIKKWSAEILAKKASYTVDTLIFLRLDYLPKNKIKLIKDAKGYYYQLKSKRLYIISDSQINTFVGKRTYDYQKDNFKQITNILKESRDFKYEYDNYKDYIHCIIIKSVMKIVPEDMKKVNHLDDDLFNEQVDFNAYNRYINYDMNKNAKTFGNMFKLYDNVKGTEYINSCFVNIIVNTYQKAFEKSKHYKLELTHEILCDICNIDYKKDNIGLSINKAMRFFEKYQLGFCAYGPFGNIIKRFKPDKQNKHINPWSLYIYVHNNHVYRITERKSFTQTYFKGDEKLDDEIKTLTVSNKYRIRDSTIHNNKPIYIKKLDDITMYIKSLDDSQKKEFVTFVYNDSLKNLMFQMVNNKPSYIPDIRFESGEIQSLTFKIENIIGIVIKSDIKTPCEGHIELLEDEYDTFHSADDDFYNGLICPENMSYYNEQVKHIEEEYPMGPSSGYFNEYTPNQTYTGIDSRKAYTSDFMDIKQYPVFNYFDIWKKHDGHKIEDYTQYIVKSSYNVLLFPSLYSRCYGYKLNRIPSNKYEVISYRRPSSLHKSNSKELVDRLWGTKISESEECDIMYKKFICNRNLGILEKKKNKKTITKIFKSYNEAFTYQMHYNKGEIYTVTKDELTEEEIYLSHCVYKQAKIDKLYILCISVEEELTNGFYPIKDLVYDIRSLKNYNTYMKLLNNGIKPVGIKTDSILIRDKDVKKAVKLFDFSKKIGCFKVERDKWLTDKHVIQQTNEYVNVSEIKVHMHKIKNEWDTKEINTILGQHNTMILGNLPGVGKTTAAEKSNYMNKLFVAPYNELCQKLRERSGNNAITLNMLLGLKIDDNIHTKMNQYDVSAYECIIFDEMLLYNPYQLFLIKNFIEKHPSKRILGTGDCDQRKPFSFGVNNINNKAQYQMFCVNQLFPNQITLRINKRLKSESDKTKLIKMKKDLFNTKKTVMDIFRKHGIKIINKMKNVTTKKNICLFNFRCDQVNTHIRKNVLKQKKQFWQGVELVCKKHYKSKHKRLYVNYHYKLKSIGEKFFIITNIVEQKDIILDIDKLSYFKLPYASTCDSIQGSTIEDDFTIFDANTPYVDRYFIWTAVSRTDDLSKVQVFEHNNIEVDSLKRSWTMLYFKNKIIGYKNQDKKMNRDTTSDDYIDLEWIKLQYRDNKTCPLCKCLFETIIGDNTVTSNITVDRFNNTLPHTKSNCRLMCLNCNRIKH